MRHLSMIALSVLLVACTAAPGARPTKYNYPPSYLSSFPLGITELEAITKMGPPDSITETTGRKMLMYHSFRQANMGYNVVLINGVVDDVIYYETGNLNGSSAKALQSAKK